MMRIGYKEAGQQEAAHNGRVARWLTPRCTGRQPHYRAVVAGELLRRWPTQIEDANFLLCTERCERLNSTAIYLRRLP
jgi:hypothetical protein